MVWSTSNSSPTAPRANDCDCIRATVCRWESPLWKYLLRASLYHSSNPTEYTRSDNTYYLCCDLGYNYNLHSNGVSPNHWESHASLNGHTTVLPLPHHRTRRTQKRRSPCPAMDMEICWTWSCSVMKWTPRLPAHIYNITTSHQWVHHATQW